MASLEEILTDDSRKKTVIADCIELIEAEVASKGGISGLAIKAGYKAIRGIKPTFIESTVTDLLPEFARSMDGIYQDAKSANKPVGDYFSANAGRAADALLAITDGKAKRAKNAVAKSAYDNLRGLAKKNVEAAMPRLGKMIEKHG